MRRIIIVLISSILLEKYCLKGTPLQLKPDRKLVIENNLKFLANLIETHLNHCSTFLSGIIQKNGEAVPTLSKTPPTVDELQQLLNHLPDCTVLPRSVFIILMIQEREIDPNLNSNFTKSDFRTLEIEENVPVDESIGQFVSAPKFEHAFWRRSIKKYSDFCTTVLFVSDEMADKGEDFVEDPMPGQGYLSRVGLDSIINSRFYPMIKKNEDYFVFLAEQRYLDPPRKILDKIIVEGISNMEQNLRPLEITHSLLLLLVETRRGQEVEVIVKRNCLLCDDPNTYLVTRPFLFGSKSPSNSNIEERKIGVMGRINIGDVLDLSLTKVQSFFPRTIMKLRGRILKVAVTTGIPSRISLVKVEQEGDLYGRKYLIGRGMYAYAVREFEKKLNFTSWPFPGSARGASRAGGSGNVQKDGSWSGVVGDVFNHRADFGFLCGETVGRYSFTELAGAIEYIFLTFTTGKPYPLYDWKAVFWPFSRKVWICCCVAFICAAFSIFTTQQIQNSDNVKTATYVSTGRGTILVTSNDSFLDSLEFAIFAFFEAPTDLRGVGLIRVQLISSFWCLLGLVMANVYRGILVGLLAFPIFPPTPRDFAELSESDYKVGLQHYGGSAYEQITNSPNPALIKIRATMVLEPSPYKCYKFVSEEKFACIDYGTFGDFTILLNFSHHGGQSDLRIQPTRDYFLPVGPMFRRRSYLMESFRWAIGKVFDAGLTDRWIKMDYEDVRRQVLEEERLAGHPRRTYSGAQVILLTLKNFKGAFTIIGSGLGGGFGLFLLEWMTHLLIRPVATRLKDKFGFVLNSFIVSWQATATQSKEFDLNDMAKKNLNSSSIPHTESGLSSVTKSMFADPLDYNP